MKKVFSIILVACMLISFGSISSSATLLYEEEFEAYLTHRGNGPIYEGQDWVQYSGPLYNYYDSDTANIPSWVLVSGGCSLILDAPCYGIFGEYYISKVFCSVPYELGYYIYVPNESKFYTLEEAWVADFAGIENVFTEYLVDKGFASAIGDANGDGVLSILDATYIQRVLVKQCDFLTTDDVRGRCLYGESLWYLSDFNRDGERTILDATAIQMKLAKVEDTATTE